MPEDRVEVHRDKVRLTPEASESVLKFIRKESDSLNGCKAMPIPHLVAAVTGLYCGGTGGVPCGIISEALLDFVCAPATPGALAVGVGCGAACCGIACGFQSWEWMYSFLMSVPPQMEGTKFMPILREYAEKKINKSHLDTDTKGEILRLLEGADWNKLARVVNAISHGGYLVAGCPEILNILLAGPVPLMQIPRPLSPANPAPTVIVAPFGAPTMVQPPPRPGAAPRMIAPTSQLGWIGHQPQVQPAPAPASVQMMQLL